MTECNVCNNGLLPNEISVGVCTPCSNKANIITKKVVNVKPEEVIKVKYPGSLNIATQLYLIDEQKLKTKNYKTIKNEYIQGARGLTSILVSFILAIVFSAILGFFIGLLAPAFILLIIILYFIVVKPKGYLIITYQYENTDSMNVENPKYKTCPECAEDVKYEANVCRFCKFSF